MQTFIFFTKLLNIIIYFVILFPFYKTSTPYLLVLIVFLIVSGILQTIIHEIGHLIGGLISHYHFLSFQVGPLKFVRMTPKGRIKLIISKLYMGQCIMIPNTTQDNLNFFFYNFGGIFFNLVVLTCSFMQIIFFNINKNSYTIIFLYSLMFVGFNKVISNSIPFFHNKYPNDMMIICLLLRSDKTSVDYFNYLQIYEKMVYNLPVTNEYKKHSSKSTTDHYHPFFANAIRNLFSQH